jgi:hypothetical protein
MENEGKLKKLEAELEKYQKKLRQMQSDWSATKGGSRYGDEYLETQVKVYQEMILGVKKEILRMKKKEN